MSGSGCFSDLAPYSARLRVSTIARNRSFSSRKAALSARNSISSCAMFWPSDMLKNTRPARCFARKFRLYSRLFPA